MRDDIIAASDSVSRRTRQRLDGLTDDELFWEPVPDCWSVRRRHDGTHRADGGAIDRVEPFTTIAWRLWHLTTCYGSARHAAWLGVDRTGGGFEQDDPAPAAVAEARAAFEEAESWWREVLAALPDNAWSEPLGAIAGPYGDADKASFVLHQLDEQIHHGAELGVLRDLYRATTQ